MVDCLTFALLVTLVLGMGAQQTQPKGVAVTCPPRDDAVRLPDLVAVRTKLRRAVARRDVAAVLGLTDPQIRTSFGPDDGLEFFKRDLAKRDGDIWRELAAVLDLGGTFETPDTFVAPYVYACGEGGEVVVLGEHVHVRSRPNVAASILATVSFAVLPGSESSNRQGWATVQLPDGTEAFISGRFVRSPIGYRAYFTKSNGSWKLVAFIGGD